MIEQFALPAIYLAWGLSPFAVRETATTAGRTAVNAKYPRESRNGNNPASQRAHEVGGFRFFVLLCAAVQVAVGFAGLDLVATVVAQFLLIFPLFLATRKWIDIAEHSAEVLHAERSGIVGYREAEIARMTAKGEEYAKLGPVRFAAKLRAVEWRARIHLALAAW